ncbi:uncharacterized protein LOC126645258 [Myiozetetes cayanensis]|uniref:uncharacterized protein LOC126645258 n=1 Tax=Myiozetetes cayanensis TaxID=478635 RepID=UPI00215E2BEC|nr:uncharacterized protein LOC126645258 [Myiozetetes cayanensis]
MDNFVERSPLPRIDGCPFSIPTSRGWRVHSLVFVSPWCFPAGDPAPPPRTPPPPTPREPRWDSTTPRGTGPTSSPSPAGEPGADGTAPETSTLGEGTAPLPSAPTDHATASTQTLAYSIGFPALLLTGIVACCCWRRRKMRPGRGYDVTPRDIPMVAPPGIDPTG